MFKGFEYLWMNITWKSPSRRVGVLLSWYWVTPLTWRQLVTEFKVADEPIKVHFAQSRRGIRHCGPYRSKSKKSLLRSVVFLCLQRRLYDVMYHTFEVCGRRYVPRRGVGACALCSAWGGGSPKQRERHVVNEWGKFETTDPSYMSYPCNLRPRPNPTTVHLSQDLK